MDDFVNKLTFSLVCNMNIFSSCEVKQLNIDIFNFDGSIHTHVCVFL